MRSLNDQYSEVGEIGRESVQKLLNKAARVLKTEGLVSFAVKALRYPMRPALIPNASRSLKVAAGNAQTLDELIDLAIEFKFAGITIEPWQVPEEIHTLLATLRSRPPRVVVEIGTASGGTLFLLAQVAEDNALLVSIDLPRAKFGGGYARWRSPLYRSFRRASQRVELLRADSHERSTFERLVKILGGRPIDFLLIDGDHSYAGVKQDFDSYAQLVAEDGIIAFHDIVPGPEELVGGVPTLWNELKHRHESAEFVSDWDRGSCGIGVIFRHASSSQPDPRSSEGLAERT